MTATLSRCRCTSNPRPHRGRVMECSENSVTMTRRELANLISANPFGGAAIVADLSKHVATAESALTAAQARIEKLERMVRWCILHEAGLAGDDGVYLMWGIDSLLLEDDDDTGLAAVEAEAERASALAKLRAGG